MTIVGMANHRSENKNVVNNAFKSNAMVDKADWQIPRKMIAGNKLLSLSLLLILIIIKESLGATWHWFGV